MGIVVPPVVVDITVYAGASWVQSFIWQHGAVGEEIPVQLITLGATARAEIRSSCDSDEILAEVSSEAGTITLSDEGAITIHSLGEDTLNGTPYTKGVWDLEITWPDGDVCRLIMGRVTISLEVTRG